MAAKQPHGLQMCEAASMAADAFRRQDIFGCSCQGKSAMIRDPRLKARLWKNDAYTLRRLVASVERCVRAFERLGLLDAACSVVDLGCGSAPYRILLSRRGARYIGCDLVPSSGVDELIGHDGKTSLPDHIASVVVSFQVLEHVWSLDAYLAECRRLLKPNGRLLLSTHGTWLFHPHPTDFRRWTRDGLIRELESRQFEVLEVDPLVGPLAWTTQFRTFAYWHVLSRLGPIGRLSGAALCVVMYARMWIEDRITPKPLTHTNAAVYVITARTRT
jgi:SAM-dependent methyltransferase